MKKKNPCPAFKYLCRRCSDNCFIGSYFKTYDNKDYSKVFKLYGISKVTELLGRLKDEDRRGFAHYIWYEVDAGVKDPVGGRGRAIEALRWENQSLMDMFASMTGARNSNPRETYPSLDKLAATSNLTDCLGAAAAAAAVAVNSNSSLGEWAAVTSNRKQPLFGSNGAVSSSLRNPLSCSSLDLSGILASNGAFTFKSEAAASYGH